MLDIKLGNKQINNLHILFENMVKYSTRFRGYRFLPINKTDSYDEFEKAIIKHLNENTADSSEYGNALSCFGIYPDEYDQNLVVANQIVDIYGSELKDRPIVEVACGNFPALSRKVAQIYPQVSNIMVYDFDLVVDKKLDTKEFPELEIMDLRKEDFDSSKNIPENSIIISRHPCISTPAILASRTVNKDRNVDFYTVLCNCDTSRMIEDEYDWDDHLIKPGVRSAYYLGTLDRKLAIELFDEKSPISWQENIEKYYEDDLDFHFTHSIDPINNSKYKVVYTKKR